VSYLNRVNAMLEQIRRDERYRELPQQQLSAVLDFSSNDYLGLATEPQVLEALKRATRAGSGGARLLGGRHREHALLEEEIALWLGRERALLFSSGYHAAIGAIPVLAQTIEMIRSDRANHASLIDGIRLARPPCTIYEHGTIPSNTGQPAMIVSESLFSMDGDAIDPAALLEAAPADGILFLDEAHALGVVGADGAGLARALNDPRVIVLGTLSKALGTHGGFVAAPAAVIELLVNRARSFIFDTALPPALVLAARIALHLARRADDRRSRIQANAARLCGGLRAIGLTVPDCAGAIVSLVLGSEARALRVCEQLLEQRIFAPAIRPPTVSPGTSRLRFSIRADHTAEQIDLVLEQLRRCTATS